MSSPDVLGELFEPAAEPEGCGSFPGDCGLDPLSAVYLADEEAARRAAEEAGRPQAGSDAAL